MKISARWSPRALLLLSSLFTLLMPGSANAQPRMWVASANYESSSLLVPVILVASANDKGREWTLGVTGWTLAAGWKTRVSERRTRDMFARLTPVNANSSNFIYRNGARDSAAEYSALSAEGGAGVEVAHTRRWTGGYRALAMYQRIDGLPDPDVQAFWRHPFAGVEIVQQYARVTSDERFGSRWEGVKIAGTMRAFAGAHTWSRAELTTGVGKRAGRLFLSGRGAAFAGHSLNTGSAFLLGGSWTVPSAGMLTGFRYAEFRLNQAATAGASIDLRIHGVWEIGARAGWLKGSTQGSAIEAMGTALQMGTVWHGATFNAGVAFPRHALAEQATRLSVVYATVTAAIMER